MESSSKKGSSRSSESYYFPPEIWNQILSRTPAKTLLRFRCVCKSWCSTIDSPNFISSNHQLCKTKANHGLYLTLKCLGRDKRQGCSLTLHDAATHTHAEVDRIFRISDSYYYCIIRSCNGLLLVNRVGGLPYNRQELRLWNPSIRKSVPIPAFPLPSRWVVAKYLFGFAPDSNDYKVAAIAYERTLFGKQPAKMRLSVYRLSDQQWSIKNDEFDIMPSESDAVFSEGVAYWLGNSDERRSGVTHLGSFDFDKENLTFLELPFTKEEAKVTELFFVGELLAVYCRSSVALCHSSVTCSIWVLEQDKDKDKDNEKGPWTLNYSGRKVLCTASDSRRSEHQSEFYYESLVLSTGYGACDLRVFP